MQIVNKTLAEEQHLIKLIMGTKEEPHMVKVNSKLQLEKVLELEELLRRYKDVFAWTYKDLKGIPPKLIQHKIELDITIPPV